jgi:membrane peptidoglycan carboxypeptidase
LEAAKAYQTIMTGQVFDSMKFKEMEGVPVIQKIVDRDGEIVWEYSGDSERILSERVTGQVTEILKLVMKEGTGRSVGNAIKVFDVPIPTFGKTGTANRFINSSFVGFVPGVNMETKKLDLEEGYVIASYIGYDENRPMKSNHTVIYGSTGALPLWVDSASAIVSGGEYVNNLQFADLAFEPLERVLVPWNEKTSPVRVSASNGLPENNMENYGKPLKNAVVFADVTKGGGMDESGGKFEPLKGVFE